MERIAAAAGVNKQLLFHYFKSKAGLHQAVVAAVSARLDLSASGGRTPAERLRELIAALLLAAEEYQAVLTNEWRTRAADRAAQIIRDGQRQGYFRDDVDPAAVSDLIIAASLGWTSVAGTAGNGGNDARSRFGILVSTVVSDYCSWR
jgi:AcrR family transcriptional regulator